MHSLTHRVSPYLQPDPQDLTFCCAFTTDWESRWRESGAGHTGCLFRRQRLALPPLVHSEDLEVIGDPRGQSGDFRKGIPADGQPLAVFPRQVDRDHVHAVAGHRALGGAPHDGDLHVRHFHKLQVPRRGNFI